MKSATFIALLAFLGQTLQDDGGVTFNAGEVALACTVGTPMAPKLMKAYVACSNMTDTEEEKEKKCHTGRKGRKCRKQKKKCKTVKQIIAHISKKMEGESCILSQLGWLDSDGNVNEEIMVADVSNLPVEIQNEVSTDNIQTCAMEKLGEMASNPDHARCNAKFNEEEMATLTEFGLKIASYKCFKANFNNACSQKVKSDIFNYYTMLASMAIPEPMPVGNMSIPEPMPVGNMSIPEPMPVGNMSFPTPVPVEYLEEPIPIEYIEETMPIEYIEETMPVENTEMPIDDFEGPLPGGNMGIPEQWIPVDNSVMPVDNTAEPMPMPMPMPMPVTI